MSNVYNVSFFKPALSTKDMFTDMEELAQELIATGRLRIDATSRVYLNDEYRPGYFYADSSGRMYADGEERMNFVRFQNGSESLFFSHRELYDSSIVPYVERHIGKKNVEFLREEMSTSLPVPPEVEEKIARLIVQSTHPAIIKLAIHEGLEIFISYSRNIADLLDLQTYQKHGENSGMQSLGFMESRVFVSCDGDPFNEKEPESAKHAMSRFMVIAAQEFGHYADVMRDPDGNPYSRHSAEFAGFRAKPKVKNGRIKDLKWCQKITKDLYAMGLPKVAKLEQSITFFHKHRRHSFRHRWTQMKAYFATAAFHKKAQKNHITFANLHCARMTKIMLADMKFNLHPVAPVYKNDNPVIEEAIICVEALARVPQQVVKWGHRTTKFLYPNLYKVYYEEVIPAVIKSYEQQSGEQFYMEYKRPKRSLIRKLVGTD